MRKKRVLVLGLLIWLVSIVVAFSSIAVRDDDSPSITMMAAASRVMAAYYISAFHQAGLRGGDWRSGLRVGLVWLAICFSLDAAVFSWGVLRLSLSDYLLDIGMFSMLIPVLTIVNGSIAKVVNDDSRELK